MSEPQEVQSVIGAGLSATELDACEDLLKQLQPDLGIDAAGVFAALRAGNSMSEAMGLPEQTSDLIYAQAIARFNAGDTLSALPLFQALTVLAPAVRDHWLGLGICGRHLDQLTIARLSFETAVQLSPDTAAPRFHLCELCCQTQDWQNARTHMSAFDALAPTPEKSNLQAEMRRLGVLISDKVR